MWKMFYEKVTYVSFLPLVAFHFGGGLQIVGLLGELMIHIRYVGYGWFASIEQGLIGRLVGVYFLCFNKRMVYTLTIM